MRRRSRDGHRCRAGGERRTGGRKKIVAGRVHHPVPGHENCTGASSFRMRGHSSGEELLARAHLPQPCLQSRSFPGPLALPAPAVCVYHVPSLPSPLFPRNHTDHEQHRANRRVPALLLLGSCAARTVWWKQKPAIFFLSLDIWASSALSLSSNMDV